MNTTQFYIHIFDESTQEYESNPKKQNIWYIIGYNHGTVNILNADKKTIFENVSRWKLRDLYTPFILEKEIQ